MSLTSARTSTGEIVDAFITPDGTTRMLTAFPSNKVAARRITDIHPVIPRTSWKPFNGIRIVVPILDQVSYSSCVGHGADEALMVVRDMAGLSFVKLSPSFVYMQINGNRDAGADPADAVDAQESVRSRSRCATKTTSSSGRSITPRLKVAARFAVNTDDIYSMQTFDEMVTGALLGFVGFDTIRVGNGFNNLDKNGVPPVSPGMGNHCTEFGEALVLLPDGNWGLVKRNSWGEGWGLDGWYVATEAHYDRQPQWQAFGIRVPQPDPLDPDNPPM